MARQLHLTLVSSLSASQASLAAMTLLLCGFAMSICASYSRKWRRLIACCGSHAPENPVIQLNTEAMMTSTEVNEEGHSVWQKNILMGGKCQLPDFSGVIIYDSDGKHVTPERNPRPLLAWK
ncbi:hypothetical protein K2173_011178 [Erythroxylum novogranatense]|uniref:Uncharacterized protein n=1 Tax=Erythroxylum novogranatense TaxID=1862640 RepID=A0AAV8TT01_9ROSI|nr:hypothetical protein K2173_011178 [Erythroxylum novogranatense]